MRRLIVGLAGASGIIYGIRLLEVLKTVPDVETHLIFSPAAKRVALLETDYKIQDIEDLADNLYGFTDIAAAVSSGSYRTMGMVIVPCTMKTLSGIVSSYSDNLLLRAADVVLKDGRKLVIVPRETPLHLGHARLMVQAIELGAVLMPPMPAFYHRPKTVEDIIDQTVNRILDQFDIELAEDLFERWSGK